MQGRPKLAGRRFSSSVYFPPTFNIKPRVSENASLIGLSWPSGFPAPGHNCHAAGTSRAARSRRGYHSRAPSTYLQRQRRKNREIFQGVALRFLHRGCPGHSGIRFALRVPERLEHPPVPPVGSEQRDFRTGPLPCSPGLNRSARRMYRSWRRTRSDVPGAFTPEHSVAPDYDRPPWPGTRRDAPLSATPTRRGRHQVCLPHQC